MQNEVKTEKEMELESGVSQGETQRKNIPEKKGMEKETLTVANSTVVDREIVNCLKGMNYYLYNIVDQLNRINNYLTTKKEMEDFR